VDQVKVGVIGTGYWGPNLLRNLHYLPDSEVVAVADKRNERLDHVRSLYSCLETTNDYHDFFDMGIQAVVIATPPATHHKIALDCLKHGLHTFIEKPLTLDSAHGQELVDYAESHKLVLMVGHTFEYNPAVRKVKEIIDSGDIGDILYIDSVRVNLGLFQRDLDVVWDLAPHDLSILNYLIGKDPISIRADGGANIFPGKTDVAYLNLDYPDNILAHIHVSWLDPSKVRRTTIVGSKKMLIYDDLENLEKIKIYDKGVETLPYTDSYGDFQCSYRYGDVTSPYIHFTEPLRIECQHFIDCINNGTTPLSDGRSGLRIVRLLEAAGVSLANHGERQFYEAAPASAAK
jgi:predicted dehydrogenase